MANTTPAAPANIKTRFLVLSDTHGLDHFPNSISAQRADVAIHCGDLTTESKIDEYQASLRLLRAIDAPLKLVIAGNHDFTLDTPAFQKKLAEARPPLDPQLVAKTYGDYGDARKLFSEQNDRHGADITFLDEGAHYFKLQNGALLSVYASPYTPSLGDWGFQYHPAHGHDFSIPQVDVVMTHGPPKGIFDYTDSGERAGCPDLFAAVSRARPRLHCFGHIHEGWGTKLVTWRQNINDQPSHLTDIDHGKSVLVDKLSNVANNPELRRSIKCATTSHCSGDPSPFEWRSQTLFVNASIEGTEDFPLQPPWFIDLELPAQ